MRLRITSTALLLLIIGVAAGAAGGDAAASATLSGLGVSTFKPQVKRSGCREVPSVKPRPEHLRRPPQTIDRSDHLLAVIKTNCGSFKIKLDARRSPVIVNSFAYLARSGFYDGLSFYRVVPNFLVQGGDPRDNGTGGPGYHVVEPPPSRFHYRPGTVAMAKASAEPSGWSGSTFFVVVGQGDAIAPEYAALGQITSGMTTIKRINRLGTPSERPSQVVRIDWVRIHRIARSHQAV
jgi:cyclophilin family peptidyl-prolyl cis-trans isomerase